MWSEVEEADAGRVRRTLAMTGTVRSRQRTVLTVVPVAEVRPNPEQPRKRFAEEPIAELAASIRERGLLQPIVVRRHGACYQLLAGERRFRAAQIAGLDCLPALVRQQDDPLEIALIENVQREDLQPLEEAEALATLIARHGYSHREVAHLLGKSRPYVSNTLALTRLPDPIKADLHRDGSPVSREVLVGIARQPDTAAALALWKRLALDAMSVRRFREHMGPARARLPPFGRALGAARKLNRALRSLGPEGLAGPDTDALRRVLRRTHRLIEGLIGIPGPGPAGV